MNRKQFTQEVMENKEVELEGHLDYRVVKVHESNVEIPPKLKQQLIKEGLYDNSYISAIVPSHMGLITVNYLPIFGKSAEHYETKHFKSSIELVVKADLYDRKLGLLKKVA